MQNQPDKRGFLVDSLIGVLHGDPGEEGTGIKDEGKL